MESEINLLKYRKGNKVRSMESTFGRITRTGALCRSWKWHVTLRAWDWCIISLGRSLRFSARGLIILARGILRAFPYPRFDVSTPVRIRRGCQVWTKLIHKHYQVISLQAVPWEISCRIIASNPRSIITKLFSLSHCYVIVILNCIKSPFSLKLNYFYIGRLPESYINFKNT